MHLARTIHGLDVRAVDKHLDEKIPDAEVDGLLRDADLIVIATDSRVAQRRIASRALALDIPAVIPGLYEQGGGEVFVQLNSANPCFLRWDHFRPADADVRSAAGLSAEALTVVGKAALVSLGILDPEHDGARDLAGTATDRRPRQLITLDRHGNSRPVPVRRRPRCTSCRVGPRPRRAPSSPA